MKRKTNIRKNTKLSKKVMLWYLIEVSKNQIKKVEKYFLQHQLLLQNAKAMMISVI